MFSKTMKRSISILLTLLCIISAHGSGDSISDFITEKADMRYPVYILGRIPVQEFLDGEKEFYDKYISQLVEEMCLEENDLFLNTIYTYWMAKARIVSVQSNNLIPLVAVWMTEEKIQHVKEYEKDVYILSVMGKSSTYYKPIGVCSYNADSALRMLQISVGILPISAAWPSETDVNKDGEINALDALLALQESVGLIVIAESFYLGGWDSSIGEPLRYPYDWELEKIPTTLGLYTGDENGDGAADYLDILLKYNYLWK